MDIIRVILNIKSPLGSAMASGTLFGQMCWALRELESEQALIKWLSDEDALWAVSDGLPHGLLPRPVLLPSPLPLNGDLTAAKASKKKKFITREGFIATRKNMTDVALGHYLVDDTVKMVRFAHNTIDRHKGSSLDNAGLYFVDEYWCDPQLDKPNATKRDIYISAPKGSESKIQKLLEHVGEVGFGRDASLGRGCWRVELTSIDHELMVQAGPRHVSLSRGSACDITMSNIRCKLMAHYGKLGEQVANAEGVSPFKYPILLTVAGATFDPVSGRRPGRLLKNVHPIRPEVVHNAFHVALSFSEGKV